MNTTAPTTSTATPTLQPDIVTSAGARQALAFARLAIGFTFVWPFLDKLFGLGFATPSERAWVNGGEPAQGFMSNATGPFGGLFGWMADTFGALNDWLFMFGLLGIGLAMMTGAGLRLAAIGGTLLMALMYLAEFPLGDHGPEAMFNNPIVDSHWLEAALLIVCAATLSGDTWGLGRWWAKRVGNSWLR